MKEQRRGAERSLQKEDRLILRITDLNNLGCGVGRCEDGRVVFVKGAVTGDEVEAKVIKVNSRFAVARLERILEASPVRTGELFCGAPLSCGGCIYRHV
ncbi:MAG: TRAM domain-containing protein, partial [Clostridia bacterium]|nr:TRAM domain-containing protein [Clostridia bacterium]